jgi:hypothetical protein
MLFIFKVLMGSAAYSETSVFERATTALEKVSDC